MGNPLRTSFPIAIFSLVTLAACGGTTPPLVSDPLPPPPLPALSVQASLQSTSGTIDIAGSTATITTTTGYNATTGDPVFNAFVTPAAGIITPFATTGGSASYTGTYTITGVSGLSTDASNQITGTNVSEAGTFTGTVTLTATPTLTGGGGNLSVSGTLDALGQVSGTATFRGIDGTLGSSVPLDADQLIVAVSGSDATGGFAGGFIAVPD